MFKTILFLFLTTTLFLSACAPVSTPQVRQPEAPAHTPTSPEPTAALAETPAAAPVSGRLVIYSGRSEALIQPVLDAFRALYPDVEIALKAGSNSEIANALLEEQGNPQADVFLTTEIFTAQKLSESGVLVPYASPLVEQLPADLRSPDGTWVALTRRARVIMYNTDLVSPDELPASIFDLTDPKWKGQVAAAGSTNGSLQAQIAVMRQLYGEEVTENWLSGLIANQVTFFGGHTDVRKAVAAGEFKLGLVNHYYYHLQLAEGSPVGVIYPDQGEGQKGVITNATAAGLIRGGANPRAAQAFLDFLLSPEGQRLFAEQNYEYPVMPGIPVREGVRPLDEVRLAAFNLAEVVKDFDATFDLIEKVGLP